MEEDQGLDVKKLLEIVKRRAGWIVIPAILGPILAVAVSYKMKPTYESQAFVLVEEPKVPDKFVPSVITDALDVRLLTLKEQILSRSRLEPIITRLSLYQSERQNLSMEDKVALLRKSIDVRVIKPEGMTRVPSGFYVVASAGDPRTAQNVCKEILSMFMEENLKVRQQQAAGTTAFLSDQLEESKRKLDQQDAKLADFKRRYLGQLPSDEQRNLELLNSTRTRLETVNQALSQSQQQKIVQESLLTQQIKSRTSADPSAPQTDPRKELAAMQAQLAALQSRYTAEHPDVQKLKTNIKALQQQLANAPPVSNSAKEDSAGDTPEIQQTRTAIRLTEENIRTQRAEQQRLASQIAELQGRLQLSPAIEEQYKGLTRDYETALQFYNDLLNKKKQSEMATDLERRQEGEQFRLMDSPDLPIKPTFPNRVKFAFTGFAAGLIVGIGLVWIRESSENYLRTEADVIDVLDLPVLIALPDIGISEESGVSSRYRRRQQLEKEERARA